MPLMTPGGTTGITVEIQGKIVDLLKKVDQVDQSLDEFSAKNNQVAEQATTAGQSVAGAWTEFHSAYSTALDVVRGGQQVWQATIGDFAAYAEQVSQLSRTAGITAEDASRLIQVADDMGVSFEDMGSVLRKMTQNGISPTIDELGKLSDQYIAIQDPAEKAKFLLDNFGRSGADLGRLMEQGSEGLKKMNDEIDTNLVLTGTNLKAAEEYRRAVDDMSDSWMAFKINIGGEALPLVVFGLQKINNEIKTAGGLVQFLAKQIQGLANPVQMVLNLFDLFIGKGQQAVATGKQAVATGSSASKTTTPSKGTVGGKQQSTTITKIGGGQRRDSGGSGIAGEAYMIGVGAQPEVFIPEQNGNFIPNANRGLGATYNIQIYNPQPEKSENSVRTALKKLSYIGVAS